jgi:hypothetical protein
MDLDRLRLLAQDPSREAMKRTQGLPSLTDKVVAQRAEIDALRRGLNDAIAEIERLYGEYRVGVIE